MPYSVEMHRNNLEKLFPAFILVDDSGRISDVGASLAQHLPGIGQGENLADHLVIDENKRELGFEVLARDGKAIELFAIAKPLRLAGIVLAANNEWFIAARHLPLVFSLDSDEWHMSDFGPDDPILAGLMLAGLQKAMLVEAKHNAADLEHQRQRSVKLLQRFTQLSGFMAHDFNNLLSIIQLKAGQLLDGQTLSRRNWQFGKAIQETAERGAKLTQTLMTLSKQRYDKSTLLAIDRVLLQNVEFLRSLCGNKAGLTVDLQSDNAFVECNESQFLNCIVNIVVNAREAMDKSGSINIKSTIVTTALSCDKRRLQPPVGQYVMITVTDNGSGMSETIVQQAFEPLFSTKPTGNGIGLASVLDFARQMGGDAHIDSCPASGTSVHIYLPVMAQSDAPQGQSFDGNRDNAADKGTELRFAGRVLLVEDEPFALEALGELLSGWGLAVTMAKDASAGRKQIDSSADLPFDLLLSDVLLSDGSGIDLARYVNTVSPRTRVMLMSGYVPEDFVLEPDWHFSRKPLNPALLRTAVAAKLALPSN